MKIQVVGRRLENISIKMVRLLTWEQKDYLMGSW